MATSGVLNTSAWKSEYNKTRYLELKWERTAYSVAEQTTTIKWTLTGKGTYSGYVTSAPFTVVIDGSTVYNSSTRIKLYQEQVIASGTKVIKHNANGTKTFTISVQGAIYSRHTNVSGSNSFTLDVVGIAKITKAPNFTDEENPTIEYENPVGKAVTSLQAAISLTGENPDIAYRDVSITGGSYTFNLTDAERKVLRAATQGSNTRKVRFYLRNVVEGNIYFAWKEVTYTVINAQPTVEASITDINNVTADLTGDRSTLIRYYSKVSASMSATAAKEAEIENVRIEHNGSFTTEYVALYDEVESNVFSFIATDSRGNKAEQTIVAPMIDYIIPTVNMDDTELMDAAGNYLIRCDGNYYNDTFGFTDAAKPNQLSIMYRYKPQGGSYGEWVYFLPTLNGNGYTAETTVTGLDYRTTYVFECRVVDKLNTVVSAETTVRSIPIFHWSDTDFVFEVPVTFNAGTTGGETGGGSSPSNSIDGNFSITGDLRLKGSGNYGNTLYFGDGSYCYIKEAVDDDLTIKASDINLNGNVYVNNALISGGIWVPELTTAAAVSSYDIQEGWYQRIGDTITIGWQIKATIKPGYSSTIIGIKGCPANPGYSAFGGGVAHNVYMIANYCFEGWCIGTDGIITLRGQPCNNTAAANLQINSSAYYPTGASNTVITLAGTICYYAGAASEG